MAYQFVLTEVDGPVGIVTINRPQVRNALNQQTIAELVDALETFDREGAIRCMILTGDDRAFAAGADISQMVDAGAVDVLEDDNFVRWARFRAIRKPVIAAVSGYALGGGCELALMCDLVVASETAQFGQPEVKIGIIPGAGGTQRWARTAGRVRAMEAVLTGESVGAVEAERMGLVNRVVPAGAQMHEAKRLAQLIAARPPLAVRLGKEAVNQAMEVGLGPGLEFERKLFYLLFASDDKREGMRAFLEKRPARFTGR
jgi:enoyl-CoA hydratase